MVKDYAVNSTDEAVQKLTELMQREKCIYRTFGIDNQVMYGKKDTHYRYISIHHDMEKSIVNQFYWEKSSGAKISPDIKPWGGGVVYDNISIKNELLKPLFANAKIDFSDDEKARELFGDISGKLFNFDELALICREATAYNKSFSHHKLMFNCHVPFLGRTLELRLPMIHVDLGIPDKTTPGQFVTKRKEDHPFFKACLTASELCRYLVNMSYKATFPRTKRVSLLELSTPLWNVKIYEQKGWILAKFSRVLGGKLFYDLQFEDKDFVRANLPFVYLITPDFQYVSWI